MNTTHAVESIDGVIAQLDRLALNKEERTVEDITSLLPELSEVLRGAVETLTGHSNGEHSDYADEGAVAMR